MAVMNDGVLQQVDVPLGLYDRRANLFVAGFIGSPRMNLLPAAVRAGRATLGGVEVAVPPSPDGGARASVMLGVRPESFRLVAADQVGALSLEVVLVEELGADSFVHGNVRVGDEQQLLIVRSGDRGSVRPGETVCVRPDPARVHVFDTETGARLD